MAKQYSLTNHTGGSMANPAKPIILMVAIAGGAVGAGHKVINPDDKLVTLNQEEYDACKGAIEKYVKANMLSLLIGGSDKKGLTAEEVAAKIIEDPLLLSDDDMRAGKPMIKSLERIAGEGVDFKTADQTVIWDMVEASKQD